MRATSFPELVQFKAPEGTLEAIRDAARRKKTTAAEITRQAILRAFPLSADREPVQAAAGDD